MKVHTTQPVVFATGEVLDPDDLNEVALYAQDALGDVAGRRFTRGVLLLPFVEDVGTPYIETMNAEELTFRFICPVTCVVERGFLHANLVSSAVVNVLITKGASTQPTGCTDPYLSTGAAVASAADDTLDINVDRFVMTAGTEYRIKLSTTGTFTADRFDVSLHILTDRWTPAGATSVPSISPTLFKDADAPNGTNVAAIATALTSAAGRLASEKNAPAPFLAAVRHHFTSVTDADTLKFLIPRLNASRCQGIVRRVYLWAYMAGTGGGTVTATVRKADTTVVVTVTANVAGVTQASGDSGALVDDLTDSGASPATAADDWSIELANSSAGTDCVKAYALVWLGR